MPSVYPMDDISAGGSKKGGSDDSQAQLVGVINASQVIESPTRRFITDEERELIYNIITKDTYDRDGDGEIDYASEAGHAASADSASNADHAMIADRATVADSTDNASHALSADTAVSATTAEHADSADSALTANNANHAISADRASVADVTANATHANTADTATSAATANHASTADSATNADEAIHAASADSTANCDHAVNADHATVADSSTEATHAASADNATSATNAEHANIADSAASATTADRALTADSIDYDNIQNVPEVFTPDVHKHPASNIVTDDFHRFVSEQQITKWNSKQDEFTYVPEDSSKKGYANGYAPLDGDGKIPDEYLNSVLWGNIQNKPESSAESIDEAVRKSHEHINFAILEIIGANSNDKPTWREGEWPYPGDMKKSEYDRDDDGIVDVAKSANSVPWNGIAGKPSNSPADIDGAVFKAHSHSNIDALNLVGADGAGNPTWNRSSWPYDMKSSEYDSDHDGVVDEAMRARLIGWKGIENKPTSSVEDIDNTVSMSHTHSNKSVLDNFDHNDGNDHVMYRGKDVAYTSDVRSIIVSDASQINAKHSVEIDIDGKIHLVNDTEFIDPLSYYGTSSSGVLGWHSFNDIFDVGKTKLGILLTYNDEDEIEFINQNTFAANKFFGADENGIPGFYNIKASSLELDDEHNFLTSEEYDKLQDIIEGGGSGETIINNYYTYNTTYYDKRQTILTAMPGFFTLDGSDLIIQANENNPLVMTFSSGADEYTRKLTENVIIDNMPSILKSGNAYIYAQASATDETVLEFKKTPIEPIYSPERPSTIAAGQYWFNTKEYTMYFSDGNRYNKCEDLILFIGYVISDNGNIMYGNYAINAIYDSGWFDVEYSTTYSKNHNIGSDIVTYDAFVGQNGINYGEFAFALQGSSLTDLHPVGDRVSLITNNTIQTTRYFNIPYSASACNAVYGTTTQHRIIVRRAW